MNITIERTADDGLHRQVWGFTALTSHGPSPMQLRLDSWMPQKRTTRRHKWVQDGEGYVRRSHNGTIHFGGRRLPSAQVPFGDDIVAEARDAILIGLKVVGPEDPPEKN